MAQAALDLKGDKELMRQLNRLPKTLYKKTVRKAAAKAMTPVNRQARANARAVKDTGALMRATGKKTKSYWRHGAVVSIVGVKKDHAEVDSKGRRHVPQNYAHLVEFGHRIATEGSLMREDTGKAASSKRGMAGKGKHVGNVPPRPLYRNAMDRNKEKVIAILKREIAMGIDRAARETSR